MTIRPAQWRWMKAEVRIGDGEPLHIHVMIPHQRFVEMCIRQFEHGEDYALGPVEGVSSKSRAHFFASLKSAWDSLPFELVQQYPSVAHLRKKAVVVAGWAKHTHTVFDTPKDAVNHAKDLRKIDEYAVIKCSGCVVDFWIAKSIRPGQINGKKWQEVKDKALDWVATLARTTRAELEANPGSNDT